MRSCSVVFLRKIGVRIFLILQFWHTEHSKKTVFLGYLADYSMVSQSKHFLRRSLVNHFDSARKKKKARESMLNIVLLHNQL